MNETPPVIAPGSTIGSLGGGQLCRMMTHAAQRMGYRVIAFDPDPDACGGRAADRHVAADWSDDAALAEFAAACDVVTLDFENVPAAAAERVSETTPVRPGPHVLRVAQHREREKTAVRKADVETVRFETVDSQVALTTVSADFPAGYVLKTLTEGYDGRGQVMVRPGEDGAAAYRSLTGGRDRGVTLLVEELVALDCEVSVLAARSPSGQTVVYDPICNTHENHILSVSVSPWTRGDPAVAEEARSVARTLMDRLDVIGVLCVEFFVTTDGRLLVNELAPRPHNSGHLTIEAHVCSQFEQQVRAVCGLPLGSTRQRTPAAMANLLGDVWTGGEPDWRAALGDPDASLHLYGKTGVRPSRKLGHVTVLGDDAADRATRLRTAARPAEAS